MRQVLAYSAKYSDLLSQNLTNIQIIMFSFLYNYSSIQNKHIIKKIQQIFRIFFKLFLFFNLLDATFYVFLFQFYIKSF